MKTICFIFIVIMQAGIVFASEALSDAPAYRAATALKEGKYQEAAQYFQEAISYDPDNPYLYYGLGTAYFEQKQYHKAIRPYEKSVEKGMKNPEVMLNLSSAYYYYGDPDNAIKYLDIYRDGPGKSDAQLEKARDELDFARQQYGLGLKYEEEGDLFRMKSKVQTSLRRYPYYRDALQKLGQSLPTPQIEEIKITERQSNVSTQAERAADKVTDNKWKDIYVEALENMLMGDNESLKTSYELFDKALNMKPPEDKYNRIIQYQKQIIEHLPIKRGKKP